MSLQNQCWQCQASMRLPPTDPGTAITSSAIFAIRNSTLYMAWTSTWRVLHMSRRCTDVLREAVEETLTCSVDLVSLWKVSLVVLWNSCRCRHRWDMVFKIWWAKWSLLSCVVWFGWSAGWDVFRVSRSFFRLGWLTFGYVRGWRLRPGVWNWCYMPRSSHCRVIICVILVSRQYGIMYWLYLIFLDASF